MGIGSVNKWFPAILAIIVLLTIGYYVLMRPDQRDPVQKLGDAINALPDGIDKAARQLDDRTPGDKIKDAASDAKKDLKDFTNHN